MSSNSPWSPAFTSPPMPTSSLTSPGVDGLNEEELPSYSDTLRLGPAKYACLMLSGTDRIQAISFPYTRRIRDLLVSALKAGQGVANVDLPEEGVWDFKLYGKPCEFGLYDTRRCWAKRRAGSLTSLDAVRAPHILVSLYTTLAAAGWHPSASVDIVKKKTSHDSIYFRTGPRIPREFFAVTIEDSDKLRLVDAPSASVRHAFVQACTVSLRRSPDFIATADAKTWHKGQTVEEKEMGSLLVKLGGTPWTAWTGDNTRSARRVLAAAMERFETAGFELVSSVSLSGRVMMIFGTRRF